MNDLMMYGSWALLALFWSGMILIAFFGVWEKLTKKSLPALSTPEKRVAHRAGLITSPAFALILAASGQLSGPTRLDTAFSWGVALFIGWAAGVFLAFSVIVLYEAERKKQAKHDKKHSREIKE